MSKSEFVNYVIDLLSPYGYIRVRPMFGGHSVYRDGVIVAIIVGEELYFKVNEQSVCDYRNRGSKPFTYKARDKVINISYWQVPLDIMEDKELFGNWLDVAYQISLNTKNKKK
ncbi:MAG: TfoX/Sxy family protein [Candidatus Megaira endosymbiont of Carteria cerasiformis]|uniref:TfoX/Sxy family protein n=1 Tax=Candidatus Megaera polyxenophila TaxID=988779 RepID=UPI001CC4FC0F|nr:TfoX/Sxy family protein [Candidatus Megaera polyxenophila]MCC8461395.1 TfoX/Sxy family protein [Candidatus Megaera polyxenophila]WHA06906.1 TfoX/Sxy family protein [Candidatus Megaera polyxenophila]